MLMFEWSSGFERDSRMGARSLSHLQGKKSPDRRFLEDLSAKRNKLLAKTEPEPPKAF
jgi:hypothetical protein